VASFDYSCTGLTCSFTDTSTYDIRLAASTYAWEFGDGSTSTAADPQHSYTDAGTYTVILTVTDSKNQTGSTTESVTVTASADPEDPTTSITLTVTTYKVKGVQHADLAWSGIATTTNVDIFRGDVPVVTDVQNTGAVHGKHREQGRRHLHLRGL
jgi:PKD repeat protein